MPMNQQQGKSQLCKQPKGGIQIFIPFTLQIDLHPGNMLN